MKIKYKVFSIMIILGALILLLSSIVYYFSSYNHEIDNGLLRLRDHAEEISYTIESNLLNNIEITKTISTAPILRKALKDSNSVFNSISEIELKERIFQINSEWIQNKKVTDELVGLYFRNNVSEYLKSQQIILPGKYGEIFLTNRYGVTISSTGKLTTLAHSNKYWWEASYNKGFGKIFLDDRGYDESAQGYVLGIVIPIMDNSEFIGILKCNINIIEELGTVSKDFNNLNIGKLQITRSGGLVVYEEGFTPLSNKIDEDVLKQSNKDVTQSFLVSEKNKKILVANSPIKISMGSDIIGFGGNYESIDHILGNNGEGWHVVTSLEHKIIMEDVLNNTGKIIFIGILLTILGSIFSYFLSKILVKNVIVLSQTAKEMGKGNLDVRSNILTNDEIGSLSKDLNNIAANIQETMASRDELITEIERRKVAEEEKDILQEQMSHNSKMEAVGQLAGGIAHNFNNFLGAIIGASEILYDELKDENRQNKNINMVVKSAERAGELTKKLLYFSRKRHNVNQPVDILDIINETIDLLKYTIDKNIILTVTNNATTTFILGDESILQNAVLNLAINSSQAMSNGGEIIFSFSNIKLNNEYCKLSHFEIEPGEYLKIEVSDNGSGMTPEIISHMFEPFYTTKEEGKGTGIGLATVYRTVEEHNGAIKVKSEVGIGTTFELYFPNTSPPSKLINKKNTNTVSGTILVIDDDEIIRITTKTLLVSLGCNVLTAENGKVGVELFSKKNNEIDLIIIDMIMPVMGGREAFFKLREIDSNIPIVIASGFFKDTDLDEIKKMGISGIINKPFKRDNLIKIIHDNIL